MDQYQEFFTGRPTIEIAQDLLGRQLSYKNGQGTLGGRIVEVEAYLGEHDSASHAFAGRRTNYSESLYGEPGDIYIYQIRAHYCFDVVVQDRNEPQGILIRGLEPTMNVEQMVKNRHGIDGFNISNGPGKLVQALGIHSRDLDGTSLATSPLTIDINSKWVPKKIATSARIGVNLKGSSGQKPYRFYVAGNPFVSQTRKRDTDQEKRGWKD